MSVRRWIQLVLAGISFIVTVAGAGVVVVVTITGWARHPEGFEAGQSVFLVLQTVWIVSYGCVALLLNVRRPGNRVGWLFALIGPILVFITGVWTDAWTFPAGRELEYIWLTLVVTFYGVMLAGPVLALVFPDGRLPSPRWRLPVAVTAFAFFASVPLVALVPGYLVNLAPAEGLYGIEPAVLAAFGLPWLEPFGLLLEVAVWSGLLVLSGLGVAAIVVRRRRGDPVVRAQLRWFMVGIVLIALGFTLSMAQSMADPGAQPIGVYVLFTGFALTPTAVAIAILRYRLYDIDVIVRRTLVYAALSAVLAAVYIGGVLTLQAILSPFTEGNALAVAASTLVVAALFRPVRSRIQAVVDRRFYRSRYDAARTLAAFGARLRDQVDLAQLTDELRQAVGDSLQPTSITVWIRGQP